MSGSPPKATTSASESSSPTNVGEEPFPPFFGTPAVPNPPLFCPDYSGHSENSLFLELQQSQQRFLEDLVAIQEGDVRDSHGQSFFVVEPRLHDAVLLHERGDVRSTTRRSLSDPGLCHLLGDTSPHRYDHLLRRDPSPPRLTSPNMAQAPDNTPKPKEVSPPTLADVDPIKWVTFSKQFTRVASLNNWDSKRSKLLLHTCMQDAAARAVEHIEFDDALSLDEAIKQFAKIFVNPASTQLYKTKFKDASRQPGEELILWHTRAREMFMRAYPNITDQETNEDLKERFVLGLRNRQLSHSLLSAENYSSMTFTELLTRSQNLQGSLLQCQKTYSDVNALLSPSTSNSPNLAAISSGPAGTKKGANVTCYHCDKPGHVLKECRSFERARARIAKNPTMFMQPLDQQQPRYSSTPARGSSRGGFSRGRTNHPRGSHQRGRARGFSARGGGHSRPPPNTYPGGLAAVMAEDDFAAALVHQASPDLLTNQPSSPPPVTSESSAPVFSEN